MMQVIPELLLKGNVLPTQLVFSYVEKRDRNIIPYRQVPLYPYKPQTMKVINNALGSCSNFP